MSAPATFTATRNACKLCAPLGASFVFRGIEGSIPVLHGSQGCATYIRRYMISHFREPVDIASSSFGEQAAIFGGRDNLVQALDNVIRQYQPKMIGVATTCLAETIGDDVAGYLRDYAREGADRELPRLVQVSTPSYSGTHAEGFHASVLAVVQQLVEEIANTPDGLSDTAAHQDDTMGRDPTTSRDDSTEIVKFRHAAATTRINLLPGMVSPADLRHLKEICRDYGVDPIVLPDYSETLDGPAWERYHRIPEGGTCLADIAAMGSAAGTIEFRSTNERVPTAGAWLQQRRGVPLHAMPLPIGIAATDAFFEALSQLTGRPIPVEHETERGRLVDSFVDAHKYVFGRRAVVFGEEEFVAAVAGLLCEIGIVPALCVSGGGSGLLRQVVQTLQPPAGGEITILDEADFLDAETYAENLEPDLLIGNSKGYAMSRRMNVPLVRVGFPIHDRIDGARLLHVGYRGTQQLFDRIVNAVVEAEQAANPVGYTYM